MWPSYYKTGSCLDFPSKHLFALNTEDHECHEFLSDFPVENSGYEMVDIVALAGSRRASLL